MLERTRKQFEIFEQTYMKPQQEVPTKEQMVQHHPSQQSLEDLISQTQMIQRMERSLDKGPKRSELFGLPKIKEEVKVPEPKYNTRQMYSQFEFSGVPLQKAAPQDSSQVLFKLRELERTNRGKININELLGFWRQNAHIFDYKVYPQALRLLAMSLQAAKKVSSKVLSEANQLIAEADEELKLQPPAEKSELVDFVVQSSKSMVINIRNLSPLLSQTPNAHKYPHLHLLPPTMQSSLLSCTSLDSLTLA